MGKQLGVMMNIQASFSRPSVATVSDFEGKVFHCKVDEARFIGLRRVENYFAAHGLASEDTAWANAVNCNILNSAAVVGGMTFQKIIRTSTASDWYVGLFFDNSKFAGGFQRRTFILSGYVYTDAGQTLDRSFALYGGGGLSHRNFGDMTETPQRFSVMIDMDPGETVMYCRLAGGSAASIGGYFYLGGVQLEDITRTTIVQPNEYVSCGVSENHGSNADGVKYFGYENTGITADPTTGLITEGTQGDVYDKSTESGYLSEITATQRLSRTDDLTTSSWTKVNCTTGIDTSQIAPDGSPPCSIISTVDAEPLVHRVNQTLVGYRPASLTDIITVSMYIRSLVPSNDTVIQMYQAGDAGATAGGITVDSDGNITATDGVVLWSKSIPVGYSWYLVQFAFNPLSITADFQFIVTNGSAYQASGETLMFMFAPTLSVHEGITGFGPAPLSVIMNSGTEAVVRSGDKLKYVGMNELSDFSAIVSASFGSSQTQGSARLFASESYNDSFSYKVVRAYGGEIWGANTNSGIVLNYVTTDMDITFKCIGWSYAQNEDTSLTYLAAANGAVEFSNPAVPAIPGQTDFKHSDAGTWSIGYGHNTVAPRVVVKYFAIYDSALNSAELEAATADQYGPNVMSSI